MGRRLALAVAVGAGVLGLSAGPAAAGSPPTAIATIQAETPISAGDGWLVWSVPVIGGWGLEAYHAGVTRSLSVEPRPQPFDANVGTNVHGAPVVTFSRCSRTPRMLPTGAGEQTGGVLLDAKSGSGCRVHVLELATGRETAAAIPHPSGSSDTTPSMWRGSVAFGRRARGHGDVWQVMLFSPHHPRRVATLRHGAVPTRCPSGCAGKAINAEVQALDLDAQAVAFVWSLEAPGVLGERTWEQRVDNLASGRSGLAGTPILVESCVSFAPVEEEWPGPPFLVDGAAFFSTLQRGDCYKRFGAAVVKLDANVLNVGETPLPVVAMAREGAVFYALVASVPQQQEDPRCPCTLERVAAPAFARAHYKPSVPFESD